MTASFLSYHLPVYIPVVVFKYNGPELDCSVGWALKRFSSGSNNFLALVGPPGLPQLLHLDSCNSRGMLIISRDCFLVRVIVHVNLLFLLFDPVFFHNNLYNYF